MPLLVRWPGVIDPGRVDHHLVQNLDFAPTLLAAAGVTVPSDMQGLDATPLWHGEAAEWRRSIYYHYTEFPGVHAVARHCGVRTDRYKLIHYYQRDEWELFDLHSDPDELTSRYDDPAMATIRAELTAELDRLKQVYGDDSFVLAPPARRGRRGRPAQVLHCRDAATCALESAPNPARSGLSLAAAIGAGADRNGTVFAHGGQAYGYSLALAGDSARFTIRSGGRARSIHAPWPKDARHLAATLDRGGHARLFVDGIPAARGEVGLVRARPSEGASAGRDSRSQVDSVFPDEAASRLDRPILDLRLWRGEAPASRIERWAAAARRAQ